jgi:hypothetical protein
MKSNKFSKVPRKLEANKDKVIIASEQYTGEDRPSYLAHSVIEP